MLKAIHSAEEIAARLKKAAEAIYNEPINVVRITKAEQMPLFADSKEFWTAICEIKSPANLYKAQTDIRIADGQITRFVETKRFPLGTS